LMFTLHKQLEAGSAALKWLQDITPTLGVNTTFVTQSGPAEFTFSRKAAGIFTASELFLLANWLEATNFPGCDLRLPPRPALKRSQNPPQFHLTTPAPAPGH
jgi:hypothetical protein